MELPPRRRDDKMRPVLSHRKQQFQRKRTVWQGTAKQRTSRKRHGHLVSVAECMLFVTLNPTGVKRVQGGLALGNRPGVLVRELVENLRVFYGAGSIDFFGPIPSPLGPRPCH